MFPGDGLNADSLLNNADVAMYHAKESGRDNYQFFEPSMNARAVERQSIESDLRYALERGEFLLHYQAKVDLLSGAIVGVRGAPAMEITRSADSWLRANSSPSLRKAASLFR